MGENTERFSRSFVDIVAKRAGNICSNPDCGALTSGPADDEKRAINVGEAAHIYGARLGSARFDPLMLDTERSDITNAVWLCRNCHKIVDTDSQKFPAALLFEWRRSHEYSIMEILGKSGALLRLKIIEKKIESFKDITYLGRQIIIDKPAFWEYKFTVETMKAMLEPIASRWDFLERELYYISGEIIGRDDYAKWYNIHLNLFQKQIRAVTQIFNGEIQKAWGPPGMAGSETAIYRSCSLLKEACQRLLEWEEAVRFSNVPSEFGEVQNLLKGIGGALIKKVFDIPAWMANILAMDNPSGIYNFTLDIDLPERWGEDSEAAFKRAIKMFQ